MLKTVLSIFQLGDQRRRFYKNTDRGGACQGGAAELPGLCMPRNGSNLSVHKWIDALAMDHECLTRVNGRLPGFAGLARRAHRLLAMPVRVA